MFIMLAYVSRLVLDLSSRHLPFLCHDAIVSFVSALASDLAACDCVHLALSHVASPTMRIAGPCWDEHARCRGGGEDLRPDCFPSLCLLVVGVGCGANFLAGEGVLEVCLARLAGSVEDPLEGSV